MSPRVDAQPHAHANPSLHADPGPFARAGPDDPSTDTTAIVHAGLDTDVPTALGCAEWALTLDRWSFATVVFMVMFEVEDPTLVQAVVRSVIAWTAESGGRVDWSGEYCWPRALGHPKAGSRGRAPASGSLSTDCQPLSSPCLTVRSPCTSRSKFGPGARRNIVP